MAVKLADAIAVMSADIDGLKKGLNQAQQATDKTSGDMESRTGRMGGIMTGIFQGIGQGIVGLASNALGQAVQFIGDSIGAASDMGETVSKTGVLFGESTDAVLKWSESAATALGQSKQQALDAAANFAIFGKSAGLSGDDLVSFSTDFTGLASDLASFNNTSPEQAIDAIGAALRGEAEPLRAYGILLDDASMRQKALELGIIDNVKNALTPQQKILAAQALIYEQTSAAQGDFAKTSGGLANQQRILEAQMTNLKTTVGEALLPVMLTLTGSLNNIVQSVLPPVTDFIQNRAVPVMQQFADVVQTVINTVVGWFGNLGKSIDSDGVGKFSYFKSWIDDNLPRIQAIVGNILSSIQGFWAAHGEQIMSVVNSFMSVVLSVIDTVLKTIMDLVTLVLQLINGEWGAAGETLQGIVTRLWDTLKILFSAGLEGVKALIFNIDWYSLGSSIMQGIANGITAGASWIISAAQNAAWSAFQAAKNMLGIHSPSSVTEKGIGLPFVQGIAKGIERNIGTVSVGVNAGLTGLMNNIRTPQPALADAAPISISLTNIFNGPADATTVEFSARDGIMAALQQAGLR